MNYEEKQSLKLERYQELSEKARKGSESAFKQSGAISEGIPFGQPILIGHHSEKRHRKDIDRIQNSMKKSIELNEKSEYYENKANNILNPRAISSDDPEAVKKLEEEISNLEKSRDIMKKANKYYKENKNLDGLDIPESLKEECLKTLRVWNGVYSLPFPSYELTNIGAKIRTKQKRIEQLKKVSNIQDKEEEINGVIIKINKEENRVQIFFNGKPEEEIRNKLKSNGFKWSPYNGCWQRMINAWSIKLAKEIAGELKK